MDNGRTLGFLGDETIKYADVTSGGDGMTIIARISGGKGSLVESPFMVFKNRDRNYPIRGVNDNVPGVSHCTGPKGWIGRRVMKEYVLESFLCLPSRMDENVFFAWTIAGVTRKQKSLQMLFLYPTRRFGSFLQTPPIFSSLPILFLHQK